MREKLAFLEAENDAVGRTEAVTGEITLEQGSDGARVTAASFEADLTQLRSDEERRDRALRQNGIETERFPTATFSVSEPINVPPAALAGDAVELTLPGDLTLHGVTKRVEIPAQARLVGGRIEVAGSLSFPFSDFQIQPPRLGPVVSISDSGTMEFSLIFVRG